jgi:hypothetical protein
MLAMGRESLEMDADAGSDHMEAAGTSVVGRVEVNSRLLCKYKLFKSCQADFCRLG